MDFVAILKITIAAVSRP